jgi:hypothetical protein
MCTSPLVHCCVLVSVSTIIFVHLGVAKILHRVTIVVYAVLEQVAHFKVTGYEVDSRGDAEIQFEECLSFDRRGGFTLADIESEETRAKWLVRHKALGGPKLLERNAKTTEEDEDDNGESTSKNTKSDVPSFRSDRRIMRLLIARHFADVLERAYLKENPSTQDNEGEQ